MVMELCGWRWGDVQPGLCARQPQMFVVMASERN